MLVECYCSGMVRRHAALSSLLLVLLVAAVGTAPTAAREPPQAVCGVCTDALDDAAAGHGVDIERGPSRMTIAVGADASTRWEARIRLESGATALENDSLREQVVGTALDSARGVAEPTGVSSRVDDDALVVTYTDPGAAEVTAGVVMFTRFHASEPWLPFVGGGEGTPYPGADSVTVRTPAGYGPSGSYSNAAVSDDGVRWERDDRIERSTRIAFVRDGSFLPGVRAAFARFLVGL